MTTFINNCIFFKTMKPQTLTGITLLSLLALNTNAQTKHSTILCPQPKHTTDISGIGIGAIAEANKYGAELEIFYATPKLLAGFVVDLEKNIQYSNPKSALDNAKVGLNLNYSPLNTKAVRPYIGIESNFLFGTAFDQQYYEQRAIEIQGKLGSEFKFFKDVKFRPYIEVGHIVRPYNYKTRGYPVTSKSKFNNSVLTAGIRF
jgi:hypothetical protein